MLNPNFLNKVHNYPTVMIARFNFIKVKRSKSTRIKQTVLDFQQENQSSDNCVSQ